MGDHVGGRLGRVGAAGTTSRGCAQGDGRAGCCSICNLRGIQHIDIRHIDIHIVNELEFELTIIHAQSTLFNILHPNFNLHFKRILLVHAFMLQCKYTSNVQSDRVMWKNREQIEIAQSAESVDTYIMAIISLRRSLTFGARPCGQPPQRFVPPCEPAERDSGREHPRAHTSSH